MEQITQSQQETPSLDEAFFPRMSPAAPTEAPPSAPPAPARPQEKPGTDEPQRTPVDPGYRPDPGEKPAPECPDSTCPAP